LRGSINAEVRSGLTDRLIKLKSGLASLSDAEIAYHENRAYVRPIS